jgi:hypothetical protein
MTIYIARVLYIYCNYFVYYEMENLFTIRIKTEEY